MVRVYGGTAIRFEFIALSTELPVPDSGAPLQAESMSNPSRWATTQSFVMECFINRPFPNIPPMGMCAQWVWRFYSP